MPDPAADTDLLTEAAYAAGEIAMRHFGNDPAVYDKPGEGPVTQADLEVNEMLLARLSAARPDYGWLSEESPDTTTRLDAERVFIIDPIDGTRAFIAGESGFAVAMAVVERGRVVSAVVHLPRRVETFAATLGQGASKNGHAIAASEVAHADGATVVTSAKQMDPQHWPGGVPPLKRNFRSSLAWRMCLVAEGRFDSMLTFRDAWEWDVAAGALIASEAGVRVTDSHGGEMIFNSRPGKQAGVVAANPRLHAKIMEHRLP